MTSFRTLNLAIEFYKHTQNIPIKGDLKDQLNRAASSISLNLSEGNARGSAKDKRNFFHNAYGSLRECQTIFNLLDIQDPILLQKADHLGAQLHKLVNSDIKNAPKWNR